MDNYYAYMHTNKLNGKKYVGMTIDVKNRWRANGKAYRPDKDKPLNRPFWNAIVKYGWDNFKHEVLYENLTFEDACNIEKSLIKELRLQEKPYGYNVADGGNGGRIYKQHPKGMLGKHHPLSKREQQSEFMKENNPMNDIKWGITHEHPKGMLGKHHTEKNKNKISQTLKDKNINCKRVKLIMPNGEEFVFKKLGELAKYLGLKQESSVIQNCIKTGEPYKIKGINQHTKKLKHLEGMCILELDNTEVTNIGKTY